MHSKKTGVKNGKINPDMQVFKIIPKYIAYILANFFILSFLIKFCPYVGYKKRKYLKFIEIKYK